AQALYPYPKGLVIATKGGNTRPGPGQWVPDGRPEYLAQAVDKSLKRLKLERIGSRRIGKSRRRMEGQRHDYFDQGNANQQHFSKLQFQRLDWHRHRFLLWCEQPGVNHDERTYYRGRCLHSESSSGDGPNNSRRSRWINING